MSGPRSVSGANADQAGTLQDCWGTPGRLVNRLDDRFGITGDMCACTLQHLFDEVAEDNRKNAGDFAIVEKQTALCLPVEPHVVPGTTAIRPNGRVVPWVGPGHPDETMRDALACNMRKLGAVPFCNPTYSDIGPFSDRLVEYVARVRIGRGEPGEPDPMWEVRDRWGLLLVKSAHSTGWYRRIHHLASAIWHFTNRLHHLAPRFDGLTPEPAGGSNIESTLLIFSSRGPDALGPRYGMLDGKTFEPITREGELLWRAVGPVRATSPVTQGPIL